MTLVNFDLRFNTTLIALIPKNMMHPRRKTTDLSVGCLIVIRFYPKYLPIDRDYVFRGSLVVLKEHLHKDRQILDGILVANERLIVGLSQGGKVSSPSLTLRKLMIISIEASCYGLLLFTQDRQILDGSVKVCF